MPKTKQMFQLFSSNSHDLYLLQIYLNEFQEFQVVWLLCEKISQLVTSQIDSLCKFIFVLGNNKRIR